MSTVDELMERLRHHRASVFKDGDSIRIRAPRELPPDLIDALRERKGEVIERLSQKEGGSWFKLRELGSRLGESVFVDGKSCQLWGVTPRGPIVHTGAFVITVDPEDVRFLSE